MTKKKLLIKELLCSKILGRADFMLCKYLFLYGKYLFISGYSHEQIMGVIEI